MTDRNFLVLDDLEVGGTMSEETARRFLDFVERDIFLDRLFPPNVVIGPLPILDRFAQWVCNWSARLQRAHVRSWCKVHGVDCPYGYIDHVRKNGADLLTPWTRRPDCRTYPRAEVRDGNGSQFVIFSTGPIKGDLIDKITTPTDRAREKMDELGIETGGDQ